MSIENPFSYPQKLKNENLDKIEISSFETDFEYKEKKDEYFATLHKYERVIEEEQAALLMVAIKNVDDVLKKHGVFVNTDKIFSHIHIVMPDFFVKIYHSDAAHGVFEPNFGEITLSWEALETKSLFAMKAVHEILHYFQYDNNKQIRGKKYKHNSEDTIGMMIIGENKALFSNMLEAVTQKLTIEVMKNIKDPDVLKEYERLEKEFKKNPEEGFILEIGKPLDRGGYVFPIIPKQIYGKKIQNLNKMLQEIYGKNKDKFKNLNDVFEIFVDASYGNKKLPLFRLIEKTYGAQSLVLKKIQKFFGKKSALRDVAKKWSR